MTDNAASNIPALATYNDIAKSKKVDAHGVRKGPSVTDAQLGMGVMARRNFDEGDIVCTYGGRVISEQEHQALVGMHDWRCPRVAYLVDLEEGKWVIDGHLSVLESHSHVGQYINDAKGIKGATTNVYISKERLKGKPVVYIRASRKIKVGEELFLHYGDDYWDAVHATRGLCDRKCMY